MQNNIKDLNIRKWVEYYEETLENETGVRSENEPIRKFAIGTVIKKSLCR